MNLSLGIHDFLSQFACKIKGHNGINCQPSKSKIFSSTVKDNGDIIFQRPAGSENGYIDFKG